MARVAELATKKGSKTRAILKTAGRGAIMLTVGTLDLAMWMFWAILTIFGFVSSLKKMTERTTERYCARRRRRIARARDRREREQAQKERLAMLAATAEEPTVIYSSSPPPTVSSTAIPQIEPANEAAVAQLPRPSLTVADPVDKDGAGENS